MTDKGKILPFPDTTAIEAEAAAWVARFDAGDVSAKDQAAFQEWLNRSALHRDAVAEYGNLWSEFDTLKQLVDGDKTGRAADLGNFHPAMLKRARPLLAACAAVVIAVLGGAVLFHPWSGTPARTARLVPATRFFYETAVGAQKRITLADGSSVILNTNSRLDVDFSGHQRNLHLVRGEAYFDVVHDQTRPFTVTANNYVVRDIGTAFDVHLSKTGVVEVRVTKGRVEVASTHGANGAGVEPGLGVLAAGHDIVLGQKVERVQAVSVAELDRRLAWRQGLLIYTGQPLAEVLADVSRYSNIKIELADPAMENLPVGGAFRTDQIEAIFAALQDNFGLEAQWIDPQHVRLTSGGGNMPAKD